ncbi:MAG TPA: DUF928 domain-containing protein [Oscillatoriaceae cyanobacterium M33_DOE_052]|nr:DUF928 domain-containing protein [Oscillatoriaceae cyanobacterium M33_DOE_052]
MSALAFILSPMVVLTSVNAVRAQINFNAPAGDIGRPASSVGGGTRAGGACTTGGQLQALMPLPNNIGRSTSPTPNLFWYVPQTVAKTAELVLVDEEKNELYAAELALPGKPGIVKVTIPESAKLEVGQEYEWQLALVCDPGDRASDKFVVGKVAIVDKTPQLETALAAASTPVETAAAYAQAGIWQETVSSLAGVSAQYPQQWQQLVQSALRSALKVDEMQQPQQAEAISAIETISTSPVLEPQVEPYDSGN